MYLCSHSTGQTSDTSHTNSFLTAHQLTLFRECERWKIMIFSWETEGQLGGQSFGFRVYYYLAALTRLLKTVGI